MNYDAENWALIRAQLEGDHTKIDPLNRAQILDDAFNLARAGLLDYESVFGLTSYLAKERSYIVWSAAERGFAYIQKMLSRTDAYGAYKVGFRLGHHC